MVAAAATDNEKLMIPFSVYEDPLHPIPAWVREFEGSRNKTQEMLFADMDIAKKIELAVLIQDLNEPSQLTWQFKVADVGEAAMKEVDAMIRREKSEHFFVGLLKIMSTIRNRNCGVPMPPDLATVVANRVDLIVSEDGAAKQW